MNRRRLTVKRLDPWSVLKFGAVANLVLFAVVMLVAGILWFIADRLQLVDQLCGIASDVGFTACGLSAGNLFRALTLLGAMGVIVLTAVQVFLAFLYNLIADLTGGLTIGVVDEVLPTGAQNPSVASRRQAASASRDLAEDRTSPPPNRRAGTPAETVHRSERDELFNG